MTRPTTAGHMVLILAAALLSACATMQELVEPPKVSLRSVQVEDLDFKRQTFVLEFDVTNPGPLPLPVSSVSYGVRLDGYRFASGKTVSAFTIPAASDTQFAITAELDLLSTAPALLTVVRQAARRDIPYELEGSLGIDIPMLKPVHFESSGAIRLVAANN